MAQTLSQIKSLLAAHGLRPKHRLGQNFLHDPRKLEEVVRAADVRPDETILEVGAGAGALSLRLLEAGARLVAVEIDRDLEPILRDQLAPFADRATLLFADVLASKHTLNPLVLDALAKSQITNSKSQVPFKLVANLPYHVASPLLVNLALDHPRMSAAVVMVQREVADRLTAGPGGKSYGPLGIIVQVMCAVERVTTLSPGCFWPSPKVDSAVLRLVRRERPLADNPRTFSLFVHRVFNSRRKQLGTILGRDRELPAGIDPKARPEQLALEQLVSLWVGFGQPT